MYHELSVVASHLVTIVTNTQEDMATQYKGKRVAFGSRQERKTFPTLASHDRLSLQFPAMRVTQLGPSSYDKHTVDTIVYNLQRKPESKKGYTLGARTGPRFPPSLQVLSPSPQKYQKDWSVSDVPTPRQVPFNASAPRFGTTLTNDSPGPGTYNQDAPHSQKVSWPSKFGSPDWSRTSMPLINTLRVELPKSKEIRKQRNRVAYLRLYYS